MRLGDFIAKFDGLDPETDVMTLDEVGFRAPEVQIGDHGVLIR